MSLSFHNLSHSYGQTRVLKDISLAAIEGEILCLLGPSGGGKSTLLRLAAGLEPLQAGHIELAGKLLASPGQEPPPEQRPIGLVFQDHILFPHLRVAQNISFGLNNASAAEQAARAEELLQNMNLNGLGERFPHELSGGQQQRVALARALAPKPSVLLLDEPFASVDSTLRRSLRQTTRSALKASKTTAIVVTHDPEEAMELADSIAVMAGGTIAQHASPDAIWHTPATLEVAMLFGDAQAISGTSNGTEVHCGFNPLPSHLEAGPVTIAVRPQGIRLHRSSGTKVGVQDIRLLGHHWQLVLRPESGDSGTVVAALDIVAFRELGSVKIGDTLGAALDPANCFMFPAQTISTPTN